MPKTCRIDTFMSGRPATGATVWTVLPTSRRTGVKTAVRADGSTQIAPASAPAAVLTVNVDAVIAALLLAVLWKDYKSGALHEKDLETAAFNVFLYGRMIGAAAEIDDHLNRGRNMDTRTPQEQCSFVI